MQILRSGMSVHARRQRWRVVDARAYDDCQLITLSGLGPANAGVETRLLAPFDSIEPIPASRRLRLVHTRRWRRSCRELLFNQFSEGQLCAAGRARIELLPHQLEPAIALTRGDGCRVLLADEVGLGKTIQAGLAIAELRARGAADRVLIITPAGLREQWAGELSERFDLQADGRRFSSRCPPGRRRCPTASTRGRPGRSRSCRWTTSSARTSCRRSPRAPGTSSSSTKRTASPATATGTRPWRRWPRAPRTSCCSRRRRTTATPVRSDLCAPSAANPIGSSCFAGPATSSGRRPRAACIACCSARATRRSRCTRGSRRSAAPCARSAASSTRTSGSR